MEDRRPGRVDGSVYCYDTCNVNRIFSTPFSYDRGAPTYRYHWRQVDAFGTSYNRTTHVATLTFNRPLPDDVYTLTVNDTVIETTEGQALDGEVRPFSWVENEPLLPSGDGEPGGIR